jgi:glyoxylate carboligase
MPVRAADALIAALVAEGVEVCFGLPGGASLPLHDALHDSPLRHVLVRHEAAAGHAADGYARATGRVASRRPTSSASRRRSSSMRSASSGRATWPLRSARRWPSRAAAGPGRC